MKNSIFTGGCVILFIFRLVYYSDKMTCTNPTGYGKSDDCLLYQMRIFWKGQIFFDFGPPEGEVPIRYPPSVCMYVCLYVCMSVCNSPPALTTPTIFLIFGMKVGDH